MKEPKKGDRILYDGMLLTVIDDIPSNNGNFKAVTESGALKWLNWCTDTFVYADTNYINAPRTFNHIIPASIYDDNDYEYAILARQILD